MTHRQAHKQAIDAKLAAIPPDKLKQKRSSLRLGLFIALVGIAMMVAGGWVIGLVIRAPDENFSVWMLWILAPGAAICFVGGNVASRELMSDAIGLLVASIKDLTPFVRNKG